MKTKHVNEANGIENPEGVFRKTLSYNEEAMLCHFHLKSGARIPLHHHRATQIGFVMKGKARFIAAKEEDEFQVGQGDTYVIPPFAEHGAIALEDTEYVEVFVPSRDEYKD